MLQPQPHNGVRCAVACGGESMSAAGTTGTATAFYVISCIDTPLARVANLTLTRLLLQAEGFYVDDAVLYAALADRTHTSSAALLDSVAAFFHAVGGGGGGGQQPAATEQSAAESATGVFAALFEELSVSHDVEAFVRAGHPTLPLSCLRCFPSPPDKAPSDAVDGGFGRGDGGSGGAALPYLLWSAAETARRGYAAAAAVAVAASASATPAPSPTKELRAAADAASEEEGREGCGASEEGSSRAPQTEAADDEENDDDEEEDEEREEDDGAAESVVVAAAAGAGAADIRAAPDPDAEAGRQAEGPVAESVEASPQTSEGRSLSLAAENLAGCDGGGERGARGDSAADAVFAKRVAELLWDEERLRRRTRDAEREDVSGVPELMKEHRRRIFTSAERTRMAQKLAEIESRMQVRRREMTRLRDERPKASKAGHGHPNKQLHQA